MDPSSSASADPVNAAADAFATAANTQSSGQLSLIENEVMKAISAKAAASTQTVNKIA